MSSEFTPSFYTQWDETTLVRKFDSSIRNSSEAFINNEELTCTANRILAQYFELINEKLAVPEQKWRLLKYSNGHFIKHCDFYREHAEFIHFGTQIWLPPRSMCTYEGGILKIEGGKKGEI